MTTEMQTWTTEDKSTWGPGPWTNEPDKAVWVDPTTGLDCMIHRGPRGALCGYVGVGPDHPWHGLGYTSDCPVNCDEDYCDHAPGNRVDVHGGLTYAAACDPEATSEHGICHVPAPGRPHNIWWFGFDCGHYRDIIPATEARERDLGFPPLSGTVYRKLGYVKVEVERLAQQIAEVAPR